MALLDEHRSISDRLHRYAVVSRRGRAYLSRGDILAAIVGQERERDALREALAKTAQPHFWWDTDDSENGCDDITSILYNYEIGEVVKVSCARNLPNQWAVGYVTESGGFRGQTFATEAEAVAFAAERAALTGAA